MVGCGGVRTLNEFEARFLGWASSGGTKRKLQYHRASFRYIWTRRTAEGILSLHVLQYSRVITLYKQALGTSQ